MNYATLLIEISKALATNNGARIAVLLKANGPAADDLLRDMKETSRLALLKYKNAIVSPWDEVASAHVQVVLKCAAGDFIEAYTEQANLVKAFLRAFISLQAWILPALFGVLKDLRDLAEKSDDMTFRGGSGTGGSLEDAARLCNKAFTDCVMDRAAGEDSRKWGIYHVVGLIFKCYFSVNKIALSRNIIRAIKANKDIPPLEQYYKADQVTYRYYLGMLSFLNEQYADSEKELVAAFDMCYPVPERNQELILNYLIPIRLSRGQFPSPQLLHLYPRLRELYTPFISALRAGDVKAYDAALEWAEVRLVDMGVWLAVEKAREICMRCLFRRVWKILEKPSRIQISQFHDAFRLSGLSMPVEETECLLANMVFKGYMKELETTMGNEQSSSRLSKSLPSSPIDANGPRSPSPYEDDRPTPPQTAPLPSRKISKRDSESPDAIGYGTSDPHKGDGGPLSSHSISKRGEAHPRGLDAESVVSAPPPYALIDTSKPQPPIPLSTDAQRRVTSRANESATRRTSNIPQVVAPLPPRATAPRPSTTPPPDHSHHRRDSHPTTQRPTTTSPSRETSSRAGASVGVVRQSSKSTVGSRDPGNNAAGIGGFRAQMRRDTPPSAAGSAAPRRSDTSSTGTRHTHVGVMPAASIRTVGDVLGNPMKLEHEQVKNATAKKVTSDSESVSTSKQRKDKPAQLVQRRASVEDPLEYLRRYDTVCVVDDSSSMEGRLWLETREALAGIADVAARYDADGVDIHFLNDPAIGRNMKSGSQVKRLFDRVRPQGITPTGAKLEELLLDYITKLERAKDEAEATGDPAILKMIKPVNFLIITDGQPTDDPESVIVQAARRLDEGKFPLSQVGIQFVQIGTDREAAEALRELDDELASTHGVRDMVDTVPFSAGARAEGRVGTDLLVKTLLGGINRRQDRRKPSI
ncbi:COP9 signalosome (CSN) subunit [Tulasnella sp. JGI-2019a]|nr:COP9 signalosome (CSN) subunit [Tulasnella sp. JGI-2019a]